MALLLKHLSIILAALEKAGFVISKEKTDNEETVSQVKVYLGFVIDSQQMEIRITDEKIKDVKTAIANITDDDKPTVRAKQVAKAIGKLIAIESAMGPVVQLPSRKTRSRS